MASRKGNPVHGWVILDKPEGLSSSRAVGIVRHVFSAAKAGHGGTLDPLATGILPIALGEATKTVSFAMHGAKSYSFTLSFGMQTTTDDREGSAVATSDVRPARDEIAAILPRFIGSIEQRPPIFSAIKIDGARAYDIARKAVADGLDTLPELAPRRSRSTGWNFSTLRMTAPPSLSRAAREPISARWHAISRWRLAVPVMSADCGGCLSAPFPKRIRFRWLFWRS